MLTPDGRYIQQDLPAREALFEALGGDANKMDLWTRVDRASLDRDSASARDVVAYRGIPVVHRVAGLTLGDADATPFCPAFLVEIQPDRLRAQLFWPRAAMSRALDHVALTRWAAGSLSKHLRIVRFDDGDIGLEADAHLLGAGSTDWIREFVTAFSWDVAALHAIAAGGAMVTTEEWVQRAALSISRSTPRIPLRRHLSPEWHAHESPRGVFCSLQPSGGVCESDNVLYAVRRETAVLEPLATMPGHRSDWDCSRLTDVWLARDGVTAFARTLLMTGVVTTGDGHWRPIATAPVMAVSPWGSDGFLLGLDDGRVMVLDGAQVVHRAQRIAKVAGRFLRLVTVGERAIGLVGATLVSACLPTADQAHRRLPGAWSTTLDESMMFEYVAEIDVDQWSPSPAVAVLGDAGITLYDAVNGRERARHAVDRATHAKWIGPGWLMVLHACTIDGEVRTEARVLDVVSGRWTAPVTTPEISRVAVRGDEIHVGYANQTIAVWDRADVCRGTGVLALAGAVPVDRVAESQRATPSSAARGIAHD